MCRGSSSRQYSLLGRGSSRVCKDEAIGSIDWVFSRLTRRFFTPLPLTKAFPVVNKKRSIVGRKYIPPSFNDIRYLLNHAQIMEIAKQLKCITFDGDMTLYADGADFAKDSTLVHLIQELLHKNVIVAVVTAAGYAGNSARYEQRLSGLLDGFKSQTVKKLKETYSNFFVMGGECNYLFQYNPKVGHLEYLSDKEYQPEFVSEWSGNNNAIQELLTVAETHVRKTVMELGIQDSVTITRKDRAVGCHPKEGSQLFREQLEELALSTQAELNRFQSRKMEDGTVVKKRKGNIGLPIHELDHPIPFCAFNGGNDVWVDIGNKLIGVRILLEWLGVKANETLHVGDQFLSTGNDIATRSACCTIWITNPTETQECLCELIKLIQ
jgi:IMP and pyridine-specific 5'-nucleotidase